MAFTHPTTDRFIPCRERFSSGRRALLTTLCALPVSLMAFPLSAAFSANENGATGLSERLTALETTYGGRLGVAAIDTAVGRRFVYRGDERFPLCSTFKIVAVSAVLRWAMAEPALLRRRIAFRQGDIVPYSPVTTRHLAEGMTIAELCAAAMQYSDNTAANLLLDLLGGPQALTAFPRSIGDKPFRLDCREPELNTADPSDARDTTTPVAMAETLRRLALGTLLGPHQRAQLQDWLCGNTTGDKRIRAGISADWREGDKIGSGAHDTGNDVAVLRLFSPSISRRPPETPDNATRCWLRPRGASARTMRSVYSVPPFYSLS